uniref:Synaptobrevin, longin-like domain protein n=1 Tax=Tanacetum cinerariifolium TaxID=118510 RepID=A0A6L2N6E3_TANCI|nr:hypothetical protein [Tanacetum cinerariifolium]
MKKVNNVTRLQALVDKKKVIITEATIRDALQLNDADGIDCLPNEEIFAELSRMGYEKPSTKLTFYKAFFSPQWKFLIHTILQCMSAKRTSWNEFSSSMASAFICLSTGRKFNFSKAQVGDLSSHKKKYSSPALTQKVFANMRRVGKGFSGVDTPLFEGMIVAQQANEGAAEVNVDDVPAAGVADKGAANVNDDVVLTAADEPIKSSLTPTTPPPPPSQDVPSISQDVEISMDLLHSLLDTCTTLTRRVENLEQNKIGQALEITKLKQRVKEGRIITNMDAYVDVTLQDVADIAKEVVVDAEIEESTDVQGRQAETQAQIYQTDLEHADKVLSIQDDELEPAELQEVMEVFTIAKLITKVVIAASATITVAAPILTIVAAPTLTTAPSAAKRRKEVVIRDLDETATPSTIIHTEAKSKDKRERDSELNKIINWDNVIDQGKRKEKEDNDVMRYQALKRKPQTKAQARKNMMIYLRNIAGFKMDYFKGMKYDDIRLIFEKYFDSNVAFLEKNKEQIEEEDNRALKRLNESQEDKAAKKQKLDKEVPIVNYTIHTENNKPYFKIIKADRTHQIFLSFLSLLRNFNREDLEVLWELVKERFASSKPKNFSDDFLLTTLTYMFEKPDVQDQVWKNQRIVYGLVKVKSWRLLESCRVHIITFTSSHMILLVERRYPLTRFTLDQMLNNLRLEVEEESEVSLEVLRFVW